MANNNLSKDQPNGTNLPYMPTPGNIPGYSQFQASQVPSNPPTNPTPNQQNPIFPRYNPRVPPQNFPYAGAPQQPTTTIPNVPGQPYPHYDGVEAGPSNEIHPRPSSGENGPLIKSNLLQMLGGTFSRPVGSSPAPESITPHETEGPMMLSQLNSVAEFLAAKGDFTNAITYYEKILVIDPENGAAWTAVGHCYLLTDNLQKAFNAYQKALYSLSDVRDPQLWYGIGLLYEKVKSF